jgi:hypothetical protein
VIVNAATCDAKDFPVVCMGGSAGGPDGCTRLLPHVPTDPGVAIVIPARRDLPESVTASECIDFILSPEDIGQGIRPIMGRQILPKRAASEEC